MLWWQALARMAGAVTLIAWWYGLGAVGLYVIAVVVALARPCDEDSRRGDDGS